MSAAVRPVLIAIALLGCAEKPGEPRVASMFAVVAEPLGRDTVGVAGFPLASPLRITVMENGVAASGVPVSWATTSGQISPSVSRSDAAGRAAATWTLGPVVGTAIATASLESSGRPSATFRSEAYAPVTATVVEATDNQAAPVGSELPRRVRILVSGAARPQSGVAVSWSVTGGEIPRTSLTDANGIAEATWTMPTRAGLHVAYASVNGFRDGLVVLRATAFAGPVASVDFEQAATRNVPATPFINEVVSVIARDRYRNPVGGAPIRWSVLTGPIAISSAALSSDPSGRSTATLSSLGEPGVAVVAATLAEHQAHFTFVLTPRRFEVALETNGGYKFVSRQNRTAPAVDTISVGRTIVWYLDPFDYDDHDVTSDGAPALPGGGKFPYAAPSEIQMTFTQAGTYRYRDTFTGATGTIVVR
ncbi:MAG: hypothetical protein ABMA00_17160 [Gemmatimonas sp.]